MQIGQVTRSAKPKSSAVSCDDTAPPEVDAEEIASVAFRNRKPIFCSSPTTLAGSTHISSPERNLTDSPLPTTVPLTAVPFEDKSFKTHEYIISPTSHSSTSSA